MTTLGRAIPIVISIVALTVSLYTHSENRKDAMRFEKIAAYADVRELATLRLTTLNQTDEPEVLLNRATSAVATASILACPELREEVERFFVDFRAVVKKTADKDTRAQYYTRRNALLRTMRSDIVDPSC